MKTVTIKIRELKMTEKKSNETIRTPRAKGMPMPVKAGLLGLGITAMGLGGCKNGTTDPTPTVCKCTEKDHAEKCNCADACDCTVKANPKTYTVYLDSNFSDRLGEHPITIEDRSWGVTPERLALIQERLSLMNTRAEEGVLPYAGIIPDVKARDNVKIIVEEGDDFSYHATYNYRVVDGRSIAVNIDWLSGATGGGVTGTLREGFANMRLLPLTKANVLDSQVIRVTNTKTFRKRRGDRHQICRQFV
ncbi:MAG: hypothetical protein LBC62_10420 [Treponema sp.]|jgi:hypothetical protein|nr:hypothetical protein [Treponema sp.]